jgi:hypothetical protein
VDLAARLLKRIGAAAVREVAEGHQSRVFEVTLVDGQRLVAKVLDASIAVLDVVVARVDAVAELADLDPRVCRPLRIDGGLVLPSTFTRPPRTKIAPPPPPSRRSPVLLP